jgi:hypothetical protein
MFQSSQDHQQQMIESAEQLVRLYRGQAGASAYKEIPEWIRQSSTFQQNLAASGRWFTANLDEAIWYSKECDDGEIIYLDIPASQMEEYRVSNMDLRPGGKDTSDNPRAFSRRPDFEFFLPISMASQAAAFTLPAETCVATDENLEEEASSSFAFR